MSRANELRARIDALERELAVLDTKAKRRKAKKAEQQAAPRPWRGPQDGCPSWLQKVPPVPPDQRPKPMPVVAKDGATTRAQAAKVNGDRSLEFKIMGAPADGLRMRHTGVRRSNPNAEGASRQDESWRPCAEVWEVT